MPTAPTLRDFIDTAVECGAEWTIEMWERAEEALLYRTAHALFDALREAKLYTCPTHEPVVEILFDERHPAAVKYAFEDAAKRLTEKGAYDGDLKEAVEHCLNFIQNKRELVAARERDIQVKAAASAMHLIKMFTDAGVW